MKAKECGISTGETLYMARKKCRYLQVFYPNFKVYKEYSDKLYKLLLEYTDIIERYSIDECFLDMTHYLMNDTLINKANEISKRVKEELGFTVNIGVANNKLLAKMASDFTKPNRVHTLYRNEISTKMWNLPIVDLFMLGRKTVPKLVNMRIKTIGDLANTDKQLLIKKFGKFGNMLWEYANGIDNSEVIYQTSKPKGIGNSVTLPIDICNKEDLYKTALELTEKVTYRLRKENMLANVVNVQLRTKEFEDFSHQKKLSAATSSTKEIYSKVKDLIDEMYNGEFIRLVGVRVDKLVDSNEIQLSLFSNQLNKQNNLDNTIDMIKEKYGYSSITRARKLNNNIIKQ